MAVSQKSKNAKPRSPGNPLLARWSAPFGAPPFTSHHAGALRAGLQAGLYRAPHRNPRHCRQHSHARHSPTPFARWKRAACCSTGLPKSSSISPPPTPTKRCRASSATWRRSSPTTTAPFFSTANSSSVSTISSSAAPSSNSPMRKLAFWSARTPRFVRAGAKLSAKAKKRVTEINSRLAVLTTAFTQNVLTDEQSWRLVLESEKDLTGLPPSLIAAAARNGSRPWLARQTRHHAGAVERRAVPAVLRPPRFARGSLQSLDQARGKPGQIRQSRRRRRNHLAARRTGETHGLCQLRRLPPRRHHGQDAGRSARSPRAGLAGGRKARRRRGQGAQPPWRAPKAATSQFAAWDWRYYAEKERRARYDLDEAELRPYLQLDNMIAAAFDTATRLFGLTFAGAEERAASITPMCGPGRSRTKSGEHVGLFLGDYFARPSKRSGAWMSSYRTQHKLGRNVRPIIVNVMSFARGADGEPATAVFRRSQTRCSTSSATDCMDCLSDVTYPSICRHRRVARFRRAALAAL